MRFLPILLPVFMLAPIVIWLVLETVVLKGSMSRWLAGNIYEAVFLGVVSIGVSIMVSWWVGNNIAKTLDKKPHHHA